MITIHHFNGATCAMKVLLTFYEKGAPFEERILTRQDLDTPEYRRLNPEGVVPTLTHNNNTITESSVIMLYIDEALEGPHLAPRDFGNRARMYWWLKRVDDAFDAIRALSFAMYVRNALVELSPADLDAQLLHIPSVRVREQRRRLVRDGLDAPDVLPAVQNLIALQASAENALSSAEFLSGRYTLADAALTPVVDRLSRLGALLPPETLPHVARWWDAIRCRPSYAAAITNRVPPASAEASRLACEQYRAAVQALLNHPECRRAQQVFGA